MLSTEAILLVSFGYIGLLFAVAYWGDKRADAGRSIISNPYIYALSLAVYCTAWTFFGSVGMAVRSGLDFLTIYIGPTLMTLLGWTLLRKIIRISKVHRITSIADFIASRYGKSTTLGVIVTIIAVIGIIPYIALQLKAISTGYLLISHYPLVSAPLKFSDIPVLKDTAFYVALILALFSILFGTRHLDAAERHEGLVAAVAFESMVKLAAFITVGIFVTYGLHHGFGNLFTKAGQQADMRQLFTLEPRWRGPGVLENYLTVGTRGSAYVDWAMLVLLSAMAVVFLPRQFQVAVVENVNEEHLNRAIWLFPLYLLAINVFVVPVAFSGVLRFADGSVDADTFVLALPMAARRPLIALFVYLGGMSAATGMVIVETVALSTMISNHIVMPVLLRLPWPVFSQRRDYSRPLLAIRRGSIVAVLLLGYAYFHNIAEFYALVSIGLVSFAAVAQFAPAILGGIYWKGANRTGALAGLTAGFVVWGYTLFLPSLVQAGIISQQFLTEGPFGIGLLRPFQLFGMTEFNRISHAVFWSLLANLAGYVGGSIFSRPRAIDHTQAALFVDVFRYSEEAGETRIWRGTARVPDLVSLLRRFLGRERADQALESYSAWHKTAADRYLLADPGLVAHAERLLSGAIGSASARVMVASVVKEEPLGIDEVLNILDETRQVIAYSRQLETASRELRQANLRLQELDRLKNEFISTVTHELRTPLTSIRSLAEILHTNPGLEAERRRQFTKILISESERLTRLINQVLDYERIESARMDWNVAPLDINEVIRTSVDGTRQLVDEQQMQLDLELAPELPPVNADRDRLVQVMVNLISNAVKFSEPGRGRIVVRSRAVPGAVQVDVQDNGIGIRAEDLEKVFERFVQVKNPTRGRPHGTGIGLTISRRIVEFHHGRIWASSAPGKGATFSFSLPVTADAPADQRRRA